MDKRHVFTAKELKRHQASGALEFVAHVAGVKVEELKVSPSGKFPAFTTAAVRRTAVTKLAKLSDKQFTAAVEKGHVKVLAQAWGITPERVTKLRENLYPDQRTGTTKAPAASKRKGRRSDNAQR